MKSALYTQPLFTSLKDTPSPTQTHTHTPSHPHTDSDVCLFMRVQQLPIISLNFFLLTKCRFSVFARPNHNNILPDPSPFTPLTPFSPSAPLPEPGAEHSAVDFKCVIRCHRVTYNMLIREIQHCDCAKRRDFDYKHA